MERMSSRAFHVLTCSHKEVRETVCVAVERGHTHESSSLDDNNVEIICEKCFLTNIHRWATNELGRFVMQDDLVCSECESTPSRWRDEYDGGLCDKCGIGAFEMEQGFFSEFTEDSYPEREPPDEIVPRLFLGSLNSASSLDMLKALQIKHILVCGSFLPIFHTHPEENWPIRYHRLPLADSVDEDIVRYLTSGCQFIDDCISRGEGILVHCAAGVSRSASVVLAWLMKNKGYSYDEAFIFVRRKRSCINPNSRFESDLRSIWAESLELSSA